VRGGALQYYQRYSITRITYYFGQSSPGSPSGCSHLLPHGEGLSERSWSANKTNCKIVQQPSEENSRSNWNSNQATLLPATNAAYLPVELSPSPECPLWRGNRNSSPGHRPGAVVYGVNTGFGLPVNTHIPNEEPANCSVYRSVLMQLESQELMDEATVRLLMVLKINSLALVAILEFAWKVIEALDQN